MNAASAASAAGADWHRSPAPRPAGPRSPTLSLAAAPSAGRRQATVTAAGHDALFACFLALVLAAGVLAVLLLNTSMQQQSHRLTVQHEQLARLSDQQQTLRTALDLAADPAALAAKARALRMRPAGVLRYLTTGHSARRPVARVGLSARRPAAARGPGG